MQEIVWSFQKYWNINYTFSGITVLKKLGSLISIYSGVRGTEGEGLDGRCSYSKMSEVAGRPKHLKKIESSYSGWCIYVSQLPLVEPSTQASEPPAFWWWPAHLRWRFGALCLVWPLYFSVKGGLHSTWPRGWSAALFCTPTPCVNRHTSASGYLN